jgi:Synergist-CTERM protein sorting domain-containing protein
MATLSVWARRAAVCSVCALPVAAAAGWPAGSMIDESALVDVTADGFASLEGLVSTFVPPEILLPDVSLYDESCVVVFGAKICAYTADIDVTGLEVTTAIDDLSLTPAQEVLNLDGALVVQLNSATNPATLSYSVTGLGIPISDTCDIYTNPITLTIDGSIELDVEPDLLGVDVDGDGLADTKLLDATVPPIGWTWDADDSDIQLVGCGTGTVIGVLNDALQLFGFDSIYDLILDQIEPNGPDAPAGQVQTIIDDLPAQIEPVIEDLFSTLFISQSLDLLGVPLTLTIWPDEVDVTADGMRVALTSVTDVEPNACMAAWDPGESVSTASKPPRLGDVPAGLPFTPHAGILLDDDFINQLLYGAWSGGLLCLTLSADNDPFGLPLALDSSLLALIAPNTFTDLFPEKQPLEIRTEPRSAPVVGPPGAHDLSVVADPLGLSFITEIDGRRTRLFAIDMAVNVGADLTFDGTTGDLTAVLDLGPGAFTPTVGYNEFRPAESEAIATSFEVLLTGVIVPIAAPYLEGLSFALPSLEGIGVVDLDIAAAGPNGDYVGAFVTTGAVSYASVGCGDTSKGCDTTSCSGGCSSGGGAAAVLTVPLIVALRRRRR